jgi:hypothetical protein
MHAHLPTLQACIIARLSATQPHVHAQLCSKHVHMSCVPFSPLRVHPCMTIRIIGTHPCMHISISPMHLGDHTHKTPVQPSIQALPINGKPTSMQEDKTTNLKLIGPELVASSSQNLQISSEYLLSNHYGNKYK